MHPVLAVQAAKIVDPLASLSQAEAQASPSPEDHAWSAQQVVEHLILAFEHSGKLLEESLRKRKPASNSHTFPQWLLKAQICWFGSMPRGVTALRALRPEAIVPQDGKTLSARFLAAAEKLDETLVACRKSFGLLPCAVHPIYGPLRVEEWRQYHAVHCRHHLPQLQQAVTHSRTHAELLRWPVPVPVAKTEDEAAGFAGKLAAAGRG
jgi:hypothetical protein